MDAPAPSIVGVAGGDPFDLRTWSGISHHLFGALRQRGALAGAVSARPRPLELLEQAASVSPRPGRWQQRYRGGASPLSPLVRRGMSRVGGQRARRLAAEPDALLQVTAWFDLTGVRGLRPRLRCSYQGGNMAEYFRRPDLAVDPSARPVRRVLDYERRVQDRLDLILTKSEWIRRSFVEQLGQDPDKVVVVGSGANFPSVPPPPERDFTRPRFLFVGKNFARKGGPQLLAAFELVRERHPDAELWIVGPKDDPGCPPGVRFFGRLSRGCAAGEAELGRLYREATAFVMPSIYEPFGVVFLEAMAHRLPCVGTDACAMPEIVEDGVTGLLAPPGDVEGLARVLLELAGDPGRARRMGRAGHWRLTERYTWDAVAGRIADEVSRRLAA